MKKSFFTSLTLMVFLFLVGSMSANAQQVKLKNDPFALIVKAKHLPENYFSANGFKHIPKFKATGNFEADSVGYYTQFAEWWGKYPKEVEMVKKVIDLGEWQKLMAKNHGLDKVSSQPLMQQNAQQFKAPDYAPHMPNPYLPDYGDKKEKWMNQYPQEYKKVVEGNN